MFLCFKLRMNKRTLVSVLLMLLLSSCTKERFFGFVRFKTVITDPSGQPLVNVKISLRACKPTAKRDCDKYIIDEETTDSQGRVVLMGLRARSNRYQVYGPNFRSLTEEISQRRLEHDGRWDTLRMN